jgi:hypothetical protein
MALDSDDVVRLMVELRLVYADFWVHYRALLHVMSTIDPRHRHSEELETLAQEWFEQNYEALKADAFARFDELTGESG